LFKIREYIKNNPLAERIRFEEFYESGSDKSDPYKNLPPHPQKVWWKKDFETLKDSKPLSDKDL